MTGFSYSAVTQAGKTRHGTIEAESLSDARQKLRLRGLLPVKLRPGTRRTLFQRAPNLSETARCLMTRQLATLVTSGVRIEDALQTIARQNALADLAELCLALRGAVLEGKPLSQALASSPRNFDAFYIASIRAGEEAGEMGRVLVALSEFLERRRENIRSVRLALLYPALLAVVSALMIAGLLVFVVPDIVRAFASRGAELPALTQALIWLSERVREMGLAALIGGVLGALGLVRLTRHPAARLTLHRWSATLPGPRGMTRQVASTQFSGTLALLLEGGVSLVEAIRSARATVTNRFIRARLAEAQTRVEEGSALSAALQATGLFPPMLIVMVQSGEQSGALAQSMARASAEQSQELAARVKALVGLAEPAILLVMGGIVMLLVMAILLPILNLNSLVG